MKGRLMNQKIKILTENLKDERSKRVIFVAHCILNENTRYLGGAFRKGCIDEIVDEIQNQGIGIVQMKCPEQKAWGGVLKESMWEPVGSKNTFRGRLTRVFLPLFIWNTKRAYRKIAKEVVEEIIDYRESEFEVLGIIGVAGSPSCGVNMTLNMKKSIEFLANTELDELNREKINGPGNKELLIEGEGFFIEALKNESQKKNIKIRFYEHDLISEIQGEKIKIEL
jgi:predicted secreted protein